MAVLERTGVSEPGSGIRLHQAGMRGGCRPVSWHQASQPPTAPRRAFQVLTAAVPQSCSSAWPISSSATADSGRPSPRAGTTLPSAVV